MSQGLPYLSQDGRQGSSSWRNERGKEWYGLQNIFVIERHEHIASPLDWVAAGYENVQQASHAVAKAKDGEGSPSGDCPGGACQLELGLVSQAVVVEPSCKGRSNYLQTWREVNGQGCNAVSAWRSMAAPTACQIAAA